MKAVVYERYGPPEVLRLVEMAKPTPKENEVLIRVHATTVTKGDVRMRSFTVPRAQWIPARLYLGIRKPRRPILGMELAGEVEAVGQNVTRFKPGDPIFASTFEVDFGGYAEYKCLPEDGLIAIKPDHVSYGEAAAAVGGGMTALRCMKKADIQPGQTVLIYGASGAVGTNAVQLAHHWGAVVTGVCSTANLDLVRGLGADHVIDYTQEDFTQHGDTYDIIFDAVAKFSPARAKKALKPAGIYLNVHKDSHESGGRIVRNEELLALKDLLEAGTLKPVIDRTYPLEQIVEAHRYVDQGHKKGNVVITVVQ
ncbi:MAG TPA: NAD(P)-dependent alcohol dehydrogenase [Aggregatilinea sp.]|uniref:NAD(P)-dependent alcohol dehydrogenase n=1 Tax=Aggregatilinea sp. TaxID=2806333 RepID=UPI002C5B449B|nr:NAD(P)-dependent alcohol dehydrogenase [Aggregatilinea sp.]HML20994.1 NAD(P)-dependent alcohol dehydrogenase [Aggregatilinea sp.]